MICAKKKKEQKAEQIFVAPLGQWHSEHMTAGESIYIDIDGAMREGAMKCVRCSPVHCKGNVAIVKGGLHPL